MTRTFPLVPLLALLLLAAPAVEACGPALPEHRDFTTATLQDGVLTTNLANQRIRINLETGAWEDAGYHAPRFGGQLPKNVTRDGTTLAYHAGNQCCMCGPYVAGFHVAADGERLRTWGNETHPEASPYSGAQAFAGPQQIAVFDRAANEIVLVPWGGTPRTAAPQVTVPGYVTAVQTESTLYAAGGESDPVFAVDNGLRVLPGPGATSWVGAYPTQPPTLVARAWVGQDGGDAVENVANGNFVGAALADRLYLWGPGALHTYDGTLQTLYEGTIGTAAPTDDGMVLLLRDGDRAAAIRLPDGTLLAKDFNDPDAPWERTPTQVTDGPHDTKQSPGLLAPLALLGALLAARLKYRRS